MRAGVLYGVHDLRLEDRPLPTPGPLDVLVEVIYNGLCGTDATEYGKGSIMTPLEKPHPGSGHVGPTVLGHEFIGTVVDAGHLATEWIGKRIACGAGVSCGQCRWCAAGRTNLCAKYYTLGLSTDGGLAEFVTAPASTCREVPTSISDEDAALAQPLAVGLHAITRANVHPADRIVLLGAGAIGSFIVAGLAGHDGEVIAIDIDANRVDTATKLGATSGHVIAREASDTDILDLVPGGADLVFETSGVPGAVARSLQLAKRGGTVVMVGLNKTPQALPLADAVLREVDFRTTVAHVCATDIPAALNRLETTSLAPHLVDRVVPLEHVVEDALEPLAAGSVLGKILIDPRRG
jgi:(R,R)-butanediol dehydrogenase/meso-butanediol dehydrogenase/diacetyl reductase